MTALLSLDTATGTMGVYVRSLCGGVKLNASVEMAPADWAGMREQPNAGELIEDFRRKNSQRDAIPVGPNAPTTPGAPVAMRQAA